MKSFAALFLMALTIGIANFWRTPDAPGPAQATTDKSPEMPHSALPADNAAQRSDELNRQVADLQRMPPSFAGTQVDGQLRTDADGNFIIDAQVRRVFDYFLAAIGENTVEISVTRLRQYIEQQLAQPAEAQALTLLSRYLDYKRQLLVLEQEHNHPASLDAMRARLQAAQDLRAGVFGDQVHHALFALEEAADRFTLDRLAIRQDRSLDAAAKGAAIDQLQSGLPSELLDSLAPQLQAELHEQTLELKSRGATPGQIRELRQQLVGTAATARLEQMDRSRQDWKQRVQAYRAAKIRIEASRGLSDADKLASIGRLSTERFDENERLRLEAAEQLLTAKAD
ncbi:lipase secretion chaperone [Stutzerimonas zhaodongensis]|uniref:lipase secretion chaperone n=1 Tax=Stutzerimonas TaxID=2901164 RepID=UPI00388EDEBF